MIRIVSTKEQTISAKEIITRGFDLPFYKGREIFNWIRKICTEKRRKDVG